MVRNRKPVRPLVATLAIITAFAVTSTGTFAADRKPASSLPGVSSDYSIVKPAPPAEPDDDEAAIDGKSIRIGDWDVTISGDIAVDVGIGNLPTPRDHGRPGKASPR